MSVSILGRQLELTDPYWYLHCYREICSDEIYRFAAASNNPLIIDCGANIGISVIYFKHLYPNARIIAFEPDAGIFDVLSSNVEALDLQNVALYRKAVWKSDTALPFRPDGSVGGRLELGGRGDRLVEVEAVRLRDFLHQPVDFLKIDVEGAEYEILMDCRDVLENVEHLFVEYHAKTSEPQQLGEMLEVLRMAGFRYHIKEANPIAHPFMEEERNPVYDLQLNVFGFRNRS